MKSSLKKIKDCRVKLVVEVEPKLFEARYQDVLTSFQRQAQIPGFREGKAPLEMVAKRYAKEAEDETLKTIIPEAYHQSVATQKISPVTLPKISDVQFERGKKLTFSAEFEHAPEFNFKNYKGIKIKRVPVDIKQDEVDKGIQSLLDSRAELLPVIEPRAVQKGDFIVSDIEVWQEGKYIPGRKNVLLSVEPHPADDFFEKVVGAQKDEVREVSMDFSEDEKKQGLVGRKPAYKIWIRDLKEKKLPELDETFAKSFGKESVEDLKEAVRKDLAGYKQSESHESMRRELFERLREMAQFPLPEDLVERQKEKLLDDTRRHFAKMGTDLQKFEAEKPKLEAEAVEKAREQVKLYFILQKVAEQEQIDVEEDALTRRLQAMADESERPIEEVRQVFEEDIRESMREAKTVEFLLANAKLEEEKAA